VEADLQFDDRATGMNRPGGGLRVVALWRSSEEVGSAWGITVVARLASLVGRSAARVLLYLVTLYFYCARPDRVDACRTFRRLAGAPTAPLDIYRHLLTFAHVALDRLFFLQGNLDPFRIYQTGRKHIRALREEKRGAILLGCHLGSFEAMRAVARDFSLNLFIVADFENAKKVNAILAQFGDNSRTRFLDASGDRVLLGLAVKEAVDSGGVVAILADRAGHGRAAHVQFLGRRATLPIGPYLIAASVKCPVYFTTAIYTAPHRYELLCEPFAEKITLPRGQREEALHKYAQLYANKLARYAQLYPDNWFNFYDFWGSADSQAQVEDSPGAGRTRVS
jgi:predicted LPLAT superfamily acyltransferase